MKTGYMAHEEKRVRELYGEKQGMKFKIKLNDEVLDRHMRAGSMQTYQGKLIQGQNFASEVARKEKSQSPGRSVFQVEENSVGPADYDPKILAKQARTTVIKEIVTPEPA